MSDSVIHAVAGGAGGIISMTLTYPLIVLSTRAAVQTKKAHVSLPNAAIQIAKEEGLAGLYSGLSSSLFGIAATNFVYYLFYEESRAILLRSNARGSTGKPGTVGLTTFQSILSSVLAASATTIITNPIWLIQTRQATRTAPKNGEVKDPQNPPVRKKQLGMIGAAAEIIRNDGGITALWKGIGPALVLVINPVLQYTAFEQLSRLLTVFRAQRALPGGTNPKRLLSDLDIFWLGALSKLFATGTTYPYIVVKSRLHAATHQYKSSWSALQTIVKEEGIAGLYNGVVPKLAQSVMTAAFLFVFQRRVYELVKWAIQWQLLRRRRLSAK